MWTTSISALSLLCLCSCTLSSGKLFGAYFANWAQYHSSPYSYVPSDLAPLVPSLDRIFYSFAYFDNSFQLYNPEPKDPTFYSEIVAFKSQNPNLRVILSVGGWNFPSALFSQMASTATNRQAFINSALAYMAKYGFDGIDIDWEFPCSPARTDWIKMSNTWFKPINDAGGRCPGDVDNLLLLVKEMRAAFGTKLITISSQAGPKNYNLWHLKEMDQYVDAW